MRFSKELNVNRTWLSRCFEHFQKHPLEGEYQWLNTHCDRLPYLDIPSSPTLAAPADRLLALEVLESSH